MGDNKPPFFDFILIIKNYFFMIDIVQGFETVKAKYNSRQANPEFIKKFGHIFNKTRLGTTFTPERVKDQKKSLEMLKIMVEDLGIIDIRLGIRWNRTQPEKAEQITLDYYKPFLDYLFQKNINLCLSIGPSKAPRWPETHIPNWVFEKTTCPVEGCVLDMDSEFSLIAIEYYKKLVTKLKKTIPKKNLDNISFQIENECFNKFGKYRWSFSYDYLENCVDITKDTFPENKILFSTSGSRKAKPIFEFMKGTGYNMCNFILSLNYYYLYDTNYGSKLSFMVDDFVRSGKWSLSRIKKNASMNNLELEIGEAQMEPWKKHTQPGNSVRSLRFVLLRCLQAKPIDQDLFIIRLWGIEELLKKQLANKLNSEHKEMIELIKQINRV